MAEYGQNTTQVRANLDAIQNNYNNIVAKFIADWEAFDSQMAVTWYSNTAKQQMQQFGEKIAGLFPGPTSNINEYFRNLIDNIVSYQNSLAKAHNNPTISYSFSAQTPSFTTTVLDKRGDDFEGVIPENEEAAVQAFIKLVNDINESMAEIGSTATGFINEGVADQNFSTSINTNNETMGEIVTSVSNYMSSVFNEVSEATKAKLNSISFQ